MTPLRTTELALEYASQASPWWLLAALPLAIFAGWWLYRKERVAIAGWNARLLPVLRYLFLAALVFLAFRPSLVVREVLTYPGRVVLLLDNSESMSARDNAMSDHEALELYRRLRGDISGAAQPFHALAGTAREITGLLMRFETVSRKGDRRTDEFWQQAEAIQVSIHGRFDDFSETSGNLAGLPDNLDRSLAKVVDLVAQVRTRTDSLFVDSRHPGEKAFASVSADLANAEASLLRMQALMDRAAAEDSRPALAAAAREIRETSRLDLLIEALTTSRDELQQMLPSQQFQVKELISGELADLAGFAADAVVAQRGETDYVSQSLDLLSGQDDFPVAAVVPITDGRDLSGVKPETLTQVAVRKQAPICPAAVGGVEEPLDIAVIDAVAPPYGVKGYPLNVRLRIKAALPSNTAFSIQIVHDDTIVAEQTYTSTDEAVFWSSLQYTPPDTGTFRYTVRVPPLAGEVFPKRNNTQDLVVNVRENKARVLFLDWKPRWETRFALNILGRLDYVELNDIIVLAQKDGELVRGTQKGAWPRDPAALDIYDMVILGELPAGLLAAKEIEWIQAFVEKEGKTLLFLDAGDSAWMGKEVKDALFPYLPAAAAPAPVPADGDLGTLCLTEAGRYHPLTRRLDEALETHPAEAVPGLASDARILMQSEPGGRPILAARYCGSGKVCSLSTSALWKRLNPSSLAAHAAIYINLISWAIEGDARDEDSGQPRLMLDETVVTTREPLQVWIASAPPGSHVEALSGESVVATAQVAATRTNTSLGRAVFDSLPAGTVTARLAGLRDTATKPVHVLDRYRELQFLATDDALLSRLADDTGGNKGSFLDLPRLLSQVEPKVRIEKNEQTFRLWDSRLVLWLLVVMVTVEWVWRKLAGLV